MGGHKGYGFAAMVEIFSAAFQDGAFLSELHDRDKEGNPHFLSVGHFFLALNVEHFLPLASFRKTAGSIVRELRASRKAPGEERIYTAGEKAHGTAARVRAEGVEIPPGLQRSLSKLRTELDITGHDLGF